MVEERVYQKLTYFREKDIKKLGHLSGNEKDILIALRAPKGTVIENLTEE
jgi:helix-turn-helix protein